MLLAWAFNLQGMMDGGLRPLGAALTSVLLVLLLGKPTIRFLRRRLCSPVRTDSPTLAQLQQHKVATPSLGGAFVLAGLGLSVAMWGGGSMAVGVVMWATLGFAALGAVDDLNKVYSKGRGLSGWVKLYLQMSLALAAAVLMLQLQMVPSRSVELGLWFIPWAVLVIVGTSNAVNLTDGLDGLAAGCLVLAALALAVIGWATNQVAGEALVLLAALGGATLGFLYFNRQPAQVFLGDTGSLALGAMLAMLALWMGLEWWLVLIGGVFVAETVSVALQVGYFKTTRRRLFRCAPLHHHFQFLGWAESTIVRRLWASAACCGLLGVVLACHFTNTTVSVARPDIGRAWVAETASNHALPLSGRATLARDVAK